MLDTAETDQGNFWVPGTGFFVRGDRGQELVHQFQDGGSFLGHGQAVMAVTISLNPSSLEFYDSDNRAKGEVERLPMVKDFGVRNREELSDEALRVAGGVRDQYFANRPHAWFTPMQMMLRGMNPGWS